MLTDSKGLVVMPLESEEQAQQVWAKGRAAKARRGSGTLDTLCACELPEKWTGAL